MSTFGRVFRVTTFGESHGAGVGAIVDGVPPRMPLTEAVIQPQLTRRRPGQVSAQQHSIKSGARLLLSCNPNNATDCTFQPPPHCVKWCRVGVEQHDLKLIVSPYYLELSTD